MKRGESLGERGIIENEPRSLSAYSSGTTRLIGVEARDFRKIMLLPVQAANKRRLEFIKNNIKGITRLSDVQ